MEQVTKKEFKELADSVKRIETALLGDEGMKITGMASKVEKHEKYVESAKSRFAWATGASAGIGFSLSAVWEYIKQKYFS